MASTISAASSQGGAIPFLLWPAYLLFLLAPLAGGYTLLLPCAGGMLALLARRQATTYGAGHADQLVRTFWIFLAGSALLCLIIGIGFAQLDDSGTQLARMQEIMAAGQSGHMPIMDMLSRFWNTPDVGFSFVASLAGSIVLGCWYLSRLLRGLYEILTRRPAGSTGTGGRLVFALLALVVVGLFLSL